MNLNKGISTPIAILLIVVIAAVAGVVIWQFSLPEQPVSKQAGDYTTQSACEEADYYWYDDACYEKRSEVADWNAYTSERYEFKVKYPSGLKIRKEQQGKVIKIGTAAVPHYVVGTSEGISSLKGLKSVWQSNFEKTTEGMSDVPNVTWKEKKVAGQPALEMSYQQFVGGYSGVTHRTGIIKDSTVYTVEIAYGDGSEKETEKEYYQILSTFEFTD